MDTARLAPGCERIVPQHATRGPYAVLHTFGIDQHGPHRGVDGVCFASEGNIIAGAASRP